MATQYSLQKSTNQLSGQKSHQFTRKKIEQFSYGLNDVIGKGYSSQVYKGKHDATEQPVAVKVIDMKMLKNQINRTLLESEIQILKEIIDLPNILKFHEVYTTKNNTYIITELCSSDLTKKIQQKLTQQQVFYYMDQVIQGYLEIYKKKIVHRDLKPPNILITEKNQCKIADFGFAIKNQQLLKPSQYNVGSPLYMAPQSLKKNEYSYKTDVWSVGIIFFELLTGDTPWKAKTEKELIKKIQTQRIENIIQKRKLKFSSKTVQFLTRSLCIDKNKRMQPQELKKYRFGGEGQAFDVLQQVKLNNVNQYQYNTNCLSSPKNQLLRNLLNTSSGFKSPKMAHENKASFNGTIVKNNQNALIVTDQNENKQQKQNIKIISKQLISEIHFCRYLFKLLTKIRQSSKNGILQRLPKQCKTLQKKYTIFIKHKIEKLISFSHANILDLKQHVYSEYKESSDFKKIMKICKEYKDRYRAELCQNWSCYFDKTFTIDQSHDLIKKMFNLFKRENQQIEKNIAKYEKEIVILDYLITAKQLLKILSDGQDYEKFSRKSKIQEIVEGTTATITEELYRKILERAKEVICQ